MGTAALRRLVISGIALSGIVLYAATLGNAQFLFDDRLFLLHNPLFKDPDYYVQLLNFTDFSAHTEQLSLDSDVITSFMLRPFAYVTFSLTYLLFGMNPVVFRATNIAIHCINALLVFLCTERLLPASPPCKGADRFSLRFIPAVTALVFLVHPMQTESVTYIVQRFSSLGALMYLLTIWLYLIWTRQGNRETGPGLARWGSVAVMMLGMLTMESVVTAPLVILLLEAGFCGSTLKSALRKAAPHLLLLPLVPLFVVMASCSQSGTTPALFDIMNVVNYTQTPIAHYVLTQLVVVLHYLRLYLLPCGQNVDHDPPLYALPHQWPVLCAGVVIVLLLAGTYRLYRSNSRDIRCQLLFAGICWYFLTVAVSSSIIPLPDLMVEHRAYLPSAGFILALVCAVDLLRTSVGGGRARQWAVALVTLWCIVLSAATLSRNSVWQSGIDLWRDAVRKSPAKHRPWYNLGVAYTESGQYQEALACLNRSMEIDPGWAQAYEFTTLVYLTMEHYQKAADVSLRGITIDPDNPVHYNHLGIAYAKQSRPKEARRAFMTAISIRPDYERARSNLDRLDASMKVGGL